MHVDDKEKWRRPFGCLVVVQQSGFQELINCAEQAGIEACRMLA
jgi:hypothetical protein